MFNVTKLRPSSFDEVKGNEKNINLIKSALNYGFHAFTIFHGPSGIGKTTVAKICAKHITCTNSFNGVACNDCESCKQANVNLIGQDRDTPNVLTFRMSDEGGKIAARKIQEQINLRPLNGGVKVIILEECQGMLKEAQALLLPILEYIPDDVKIIACTTDRHLLLPTFVGRAVSYQFVPPTREQVIDLLNYICQFNGITVMGNAIIPRIVDYSGGVPRVSIMNLQKLSAHGTTLTAELVQDYLNIVDETLYIEYLNLIRGDIGLTLDFIDRLERDQIAINDFVKGLNNFLIKIVTLRYRKTYLPEHVLKQCEAFLKRTDEDDLMKIQGIIANEAIKFTSIEHSKPLLISMTFLLMRRNNSDILQEPMKSVSQVTREKDEIINKQMKTAKDNTDNREGIMDPMNVNALVEGMGARIIKSKE